MGTGTSALPSRGKLRDIILLRLHHMLADRQECLESWLLHAFQKLDSSNMGYVPLDAVYFIAESVGGKKSATPSREDCRRLAHAFDFDADGRFRYMRFIWFVLPPGKMFIREDKTIGLHGIFQVSKGSWDVGHVPITIKRLEMNQQTLELVDDTRVHISLLATLSHPNLLRYMGSTLSDLTLWVCQEWSEASSIRTILAAFGRMSEPTIRRYVIQVIEGLLFLHANNILHKEIHGESVYIDTSGLVKMGEFSVGPALHALNARSRNSNDSLYAKFPPPEVNQRPNAWGTKADVWSVGLLALEMLFGTAFVNPPPAAAPAPPPIPDSVSPAFRAFCVHCFEMNPRDRATAEELTLHPFFQLEQDTKGT
ncbi:STE/STE11 protein kinase [Aphanomyces astaci]|uniref:STE/STE11 protein kinase n=1 Tax=Aphanomyces astaci TaxID=112090 RepID=W4HAN1_APHAT|nr:STE/STE11 protein kinase [Aphanomyces astaci]ETV88344.1 STE/STE11 protein kinase [Aphanomyces astaci]|eukprot:XP_009823207.1 STE/STE11 protein kinase [Aphanomyces astaci]